MISVDKLTFRYQPTSTPIFEDFSWEVAQGEAWAVIGPSGCGKTTLLYLLAGLLQTTAGEIRIAGQAVQRPRPETGLILQDYGLLPWASVWDNAALGLTIRDFYGPDGRHAPREGILTSAESESRVAHWLARLGIEKQRDKYPGQISGGQRQRLSIARAILANPQILIMDEATSNLDTESEQLIQASMRDLLHGRTTFLVAHRLSTIINADRIFVLDGGQIVQTGTYAELVDRPGLFHELVKRQIA